MYTSLFFFILYMKSSASVLKVCKVCICIYCAHLTMKTKWRAISVHVHCRLYAHLKVSHECILKKCAPGLQIRTLCTQFMQIFCTLSRVSWNSWKSLLKVCIRVLDAYILQTTCILYAYPWVYFDPDLGRQYFGAIEIPYTLVATCFIMLIKLLVKKSDLLCMYTICTL